MELPLNCLLIIFCLVLLPFFFFFFFFFFWYWVVGDIYKSRKLIPSQLIHLQRFSYQSIETVFKIKILSLKAHPKLLCQKKIKLFQKEHTRFGVPVIAQQSMNPTSIHEDAGLIPGLAQWVMDLAGIAMSCDVDKATDPVLLWLWHRSAATAPIWPLAWEAPYAAGAVGKRQIKKKLFI